MEPEARAEGWPALRRGAPCFLSLEAQERCGWPSCRVLRRWEEAKSWSNARLELATEPPAPGSHYKKLFGRRPGGGSCADCGCCLGSLYPCKSQGGGFASLTFNSCRQAKRVKPKRRLEDSDTLEAAAAAVSRALKARRVDVQEIAKLRGRSRQASKARKRLGDFGGSAVF